jgi:hypothetical protein
MWSHVVSAASASAMTWQRGVKFASNLPSVTIDTSPPLTTSTVLWGTRMEGVALTAKRAMNGAP